MAIGQTTLTMQVDRGLVNDLEEYRRFKGARSRAEVGREILKKALWKFKTQGASKEPVVTRSRDDAEKDIPPTQNVGG